MNKTVRFVTASALLVPALLASQAAMSQSAIVTPRSISFDAAQVLALEAVTKCRADGYRVTVAVVDRNGRTRVLMHDDGASPHTGENAQRKAYTALTFRRPSVEMGKNFAANPAGIGTMNLEKITGGEGGLPIRAGNEVVGGVGVSGAPGGDKDAVCAQAGIDKIAKGLAN